MSSRTLDIGQVLKTFTGEVYKNGEKDMALKDVLLTYLASGDRMGLSPQEQGAAWALGQHIGMNSGVITLETHQWDLLKKLCDNGKATDGRVEEPIFALPITQQAKNMVDAAEQTKSKVDA